MTREETEAVERIKASLARELEERKIAATWQQEERKRENAEKLSMATTAAGFANEALRGLLLVNGGAAIALMTLIGNVGHGANGSTAVRLAAGRIKDALTLFSVGLAAAVAAFILAYLAQTVMREGGQRAQFWWGGGGRIVACLFALVSLVVFIIGILAAVRGVTVSIPATTSGHF